MTNLCRDTDDTERLVNIASSTYCFYECLFFFRAITHDEETYPNPDEFQPERFFNANGTLNDDTIGYAYGFGRRYVECAYMTGETLTYCAGFVPAGTQLIQWYVVPLPDEHEE